MRIEEAFHELDEKFDSHGFGGGDMAAVAGPEYLLGSVNSTHCRPNGGTAA